MTEEYEGHHFIKGVLRALGERFSENERKIQALAQRVAILEAHSEKVEDDRDKLAKRVSELTMKVTATNINARHVQ